MTEATINGVPPSAPLFHGTDPAVLNQILNLFDAASYYFADDITSEWALARTSLNQAVYLINRAKLSFPAITHLHGHRPQLFTLTDLTDRVLTDARNRHDK